MIALAEAMPAVAERRRAIAGSWYVRLLDLTQHAALECISYYWHFVDVVWVAVFSVVYLWSTAR